ncbi:ShlB/FhaC/HecB family hemolysin secretion/activation protein [Luteimonas sp. e5]
MREVQLKRCRQLVLGCGLFPVLAVAQSAATQQGQGVQRIDEYYEQRRQIQPQPAEADPVQQPAPPDPATLPAEASTRFRLNDVRFTASELLPPDALEEIRTRHVGRDVSLADLNTIVDEVNALYEARGINTARALLREQSIEDGVVELTLVEGRLGKMEVTGETHVPIAFVQRRIHQREGEIVQADRLRDDLVYLNRTSDLQVRALLSPGQQPGQTDITLLAEVPARRSWGVFIDNAGIESTGRERLGVQGQFWGLAGVNDLLSGSIAHSRGGLEGRVSYSGLINRRNGRLGVNIIRNQINIIDGAYVDLEITGQSTSYGFDYVQPWIASQNWLFSTVASVSRGTSTTDIAGQRVSDITSTTISVGLNTSYRADGYEWTFYQGFSNINADETLAEGSRFTTANGATSWTQRLGGTGLLARAQLGWQFSSGDFLPSSNLFQVGGIGSVRGYVRGALSGVKGYFGSIELHRPYRGNHDIYAFYDHGSVRGDYPESASISSIGLGLTGQFARRYSYSLDIGHPLDTVLRDQDSIRADFRLSARW